MSVICNVCRLPITDPVEAEKDRIYVVGNGTMLPPQKKHDVCDRAYSAEKKGLTKRTDLEAMPRAARLRFLGRLRPQQPQVRERSR